jgi:hypothetical protein
MNLKKSFSRNSLIRLALLIASVAVMLLVMPRADHQSFTYELNQPWKYQLLTAPADMPILRDSTSLRQMRDSIDRSFIPVVRMDRDVAHINLQRFNTAVGQGLPASEHRFLSGMLKEVYAKGIVETEIFDNIRSRNDKTLRVAENSGGDNTIHTIDASEMLSPAKAFNFIDSAYTQASGVKDARLDENVQRALNISLNPNVVVDSAADSKMREQEYITVNGALGVIKKGQRIVDRGEIITPQIFTNLNTYQEIVSQQSGDKEKRTFFTIGQGLYILIILSVLFIYLRSYRSTFYDDLRKMTFLTTFITLFEVFAVVMFEYFHNGFYLVPFAALPVIIMVFFDSRTAIFSLLSVVLVSAAVATFQFEFIFYELMAGITATLSIRQLSKRSQLLRTGLITFLVYTVCYLAVCLINEGDLQNFQWRIVGVFGVNSIALSFAYILIVVIEKTFGFTSTVTLVELSDINNRLLRRLAEEAPGTFQHSMQVSTLGAEAARAIGANTQLVRTGALYHDIGKLESPIFFTENQHGINPHAGLDPATSARKIISHIPAGLQLAQKEKLPQVIRDFIAEHHGRGITRYFYNTAVNDNPDKEIDKSQFTYPGPNPRSKETTILMMADSVEAASRSLKDYSPASIDVLVERIISSQEADGLYKDSPISFKDIETVKATFKKRLATIYHGRVAYPELHRPATASSDTDSKESL